MKSISRNGQPGVKCNLKAVQGDLFLLEKCIFFVSKQPVLVDISDIHQVSFSRVGSAMSARTFDMNVVTKSGPEYTFTSINKEEHDGVDAFLKEKKVRVKNEMVPDADILAAVDDSDEEMQSVASDDDEPPRARRAGDDDDEDSEEGNHPTVLIIFPIDAYTTIVQMPTFRPHPLTGDLLRSQTRTRTALRLPPTLVVINPLKRQKQRRP